MRLTVSGRISLLPLSSTSRRTVGFPTSGDAIDTLFSSEYTTHQDWEQLCISNKVQYYISNTSTVSDMSDYYDNLYLARSGKGFSGLKIAIVQLEESVGVTCIY